MKFTRSVTIIALISLCMSLAIIAYGEDALDSQIQRLREGKALTMSDAESLNIRKNTYDNFLNFAAELYVEHVKWSLISPEKQGGWPYRSFIVEEPAWIQKIYQRLKQKAEKTDDPIFDYTLICPALYLENEPEVERILTRLERKDQFLYKQALSNLDSWKAEVSKRLRARR